MVGAALLAGVAASFLSYWRRVHRYLRLAREGILRWGTVSSAKRWSRDSGRVAVTLDDAQGTGTRRFWTSASFVRNNPPDTVMALLTDPMDPDSMAPDDTVARSTDLAPVSSYGRVSDPLRARTRVGNEFRVAAGPRSTTLPLALLPWWNGRSAAPRSRTAIRSRRVRDSTGAPSARVLSTPLPEPDGRENFGQCTTAGSSMLRTAASGKAGPVTGHGAGQAQVVRTERVGGKERRAVRCCRTRSSPPVRAPRDRGTPGRPRRFELVQEDRRSGGLSRRAVRRASHTYSTSPATAASASFGDAKSLAG